MDGQQNRFGPLLLQLDQLVHEVPRLLQVFDSTLLLVSFQVLGRTPHEVNERPLAVQLD